MANLKSWKESITLDPTKKGSYLRIADDIRKVIQNSGVVDDISSPFSFIVHYASAEKLAYVMLGLAKEKSTSQVFGKNRECDLRIEATLEAASQVYSSSNAAHLPGEKDVRWIFSERKSCLNGNGRVKESWKSFIENDNEARYLNKKHMLSARVIRNKFFHEIGPTHLCHILETAEFLIPKMKEFLKGREYIKPYLEQLNS